MLSKLIRSTTNTCNVVGHKISKNHFTTNVENASRMTRNKSALNAAKTKKTNRALYILPVIGLISFAFYDINTNENGSLNQLYKDSALDKQIKKIVRQINDRLEQDVYMPSTDRILPDFPGAPCYGNVPPGTPAPPLLVVDLEKTLIGSVYDGQHGWRHAKRPGVDQFINALSQYYEIAIISENDIGVVAELLQKIDPEGKCHKFGNAVLELKGTTYLKRLDFMNRSLSKIILIDDNEESYKGFEENVLKIKPYTDVTDKRDRSLLDLIPLLQAIVHESTESTDFRDVLNNLGTHEAEEAAIEYQVRLAKVKEEQWNKRNRGLGKLLRGNMQHTVVDMDTQSVGPSLSDLATGESSNSMRNNANPKNVPNVNMALVAEATSVPAPPTALIKSGYIKEPAGSASLTNKAAPTKKKGALFSWIDEAASRNEEYEARKREKMNEIYMKRHMERMEQEQKQKEKQDLDAF